MVETKEKTGHCDNHIADDAKANPDSAQVGLSHLHGTLEDFNYSQWNLT